MSDKVATFLAFVFIGAAFTLMLLYAYEIGVHWHAVS
jgi:hypothetical protein